MGRTVPETENKIRENQLSEMTGGYTKEEVSEKSDRGKVYGGCIKPKFSGGIQK